ncbi:MAG: PKD domain-containing protein [Patescibacteria group bacterium]|nr:PKD domain-containing protein [Patescibacteria group bacterium]
MFNMSGKKFFLLGFVIVLLIAIPLTVYLAQKQQEVRSHAAPNTTLSFQQTSPPAGSPVTVNNTVSLDLYLDPHNGANLVSFLSLSIRYDPQYLGSPVFTPDTADSLLIPGVSATPVIDQTNGLIQENFAVAGSAALGGTQGVSSKIMLGSFSFTAIATTSAGTPTQITFDGTKAYSTNPTDPSSQNVFLASSSTPASIVIVEAASATPPVSASPTVAGAGPVCQSFTADRTASGNAPFDIAFTATGNDSNATISKVTFNFGDGPTQDVTQSGGIGTNSVSVQIAHTYHNPGSYTASAIFTDSNNAVSAVGTCTLPVTVFAASTGTTGGTGGSGSGTGSVSAGLSPTQTTEATQTQPTNIQNTTTVTPGPNGKILGVGAMGAVLSILGATLFFGL